MICSDNSFSNSLGHKSLEAFIGHWKKLKTDNIPLLNNYFNTKNIFNDYQKTLSNKTIESIEPADIIEIEEPKVEEKKEEEKVEAPTVKAPAKKPAAKRKSTTKKKK